MKPVLSAAWDLRIQARRAYLYRREDDQPVGALTAAEAVILGLMDGTRSLGELEEILKQAAGEQGATLLHSLQSRLKPLLVDSQPRRLPFEPQVLAQVLPPDPSEGLRPLPGPRVLHWWVTNYCPKRCVYCFARPILGGQAADVLITRAQLRKIFQEAAALGAESLLVAGAEPLLRPDLPECMGDAIQAGITPYLTTKYPIQPELAERLASAGMRHISLSLDSLDEEENRILIGSAAYPGQVRRSVKNLADAGLAFSIQAVATQLNPNSLYAVAQFAAEANAKVLQVVPFEPVAWPIGAYSNDDLMLKDTKQLEREVNSLANQFPSLKVELFEELGTGSRSGYQCDIGMTKLFFLPDGVVHRCYKLTHDSHLCGQDLRKTSVAAAWHDPDFREIVSPPRTKYIGSACHQCSHFDNCHIDGRCIYQAWVDHGRYESKDRRCGGPYALPLSARG